MLNRVILMGRLVSDPELKTTPSGVSVTSVRLAVDRSYAKSGEERKADFIDIVAWRNTAEFICKYFGKGALIAVEGQLQTRTYQAKDGTNRYVVEVVVDNVSFTGERRDNAGGHQPPQQAAPPQQTQQTQQTQGSYQQAAPPQGYQQASQGYQSQDEYYEQALDDDLPF